MAPSSSAATSDLAATRVAELEQNLIHKGKERGYVTYEEVQALYAGDGDSLDAMDALVVQLVEEGVTLVPAARVRGLLDEMAAAREPKAVRAPKKDVRGPLDLMELYEGDIRQFQPLTHDQERWLFVALECARMSPGNPELGQEALTELVRQFFLQSALAASREAAYLAQTLRRTGDSRLAVAGSEQVARVIEEAQARRQDNLGAPSSVLSELLRQCPNKNHRQLYDLCAHLWALPTSLLQLLQDRVLASRSERLQTRTINQHLGGPSEIRELLAEAGRLASAARQTVIQHSLWLVTTLAWRYGNQGLTMLDLCQEGSLGLMKAVDMFDYRQGNRFSTYAWHWIRQHVARAIAEQSRLIRVPIYLHELLRKIDEGRMDLRRTLGRDPTSRELAERCELSERQVKRALEREPTIHHLDSLLCCSQFPLDWLGPGVGFLQIRPCPTRQAAATRYMYGADDRDDEFEWPPCLDADMPMEKAAGEREAAYLLLTLAPLSAPESLVDETELRLLSESLQEVLHELPNRERLVIERRFGLTDGTRYTLEEVGSALGVTRERARQLQEKALRKLKHPKRLRRLLRYL
jgi:RNA polymerase primary sigma factor